MAMMLLTYVILYSNEFLIAISRSPRYLQASAVDSTAVKIDRSRLYFIYYGKRLGRSLPATFVFLFSVEGAFFLFS